MKEIAKEAAEAGLVWYENEKAKERIQPHFS